MSTSAICEQEESECDSDDACSGNLKCCEGERCGTSKCIEPVRDIVPTRRIGTYLPFSSVGYSPSKGWHGVKFELFLCVEWLNRNLSDFAKRVFPNSNAFRYYSILLLF